jgi:hypothetical protein
LWADFAASAKIQGIGKTIGRGKTSPREGAFDLRQWIYNNIFVVHVACHQISAVHQLAHAGLYILLTFVGILFETCSQDHANKAQNALSLSQYETLRN